MTHKQTVEYAAWKNAIRRCHNEDDLRYQYYGATGLSVADIYRDPIDGFDEFLAEVGPRPSDNHSLERKNNLLGYQPKNIEWVLHRDNCNNRRPYGTVSRLDFGEGFTGRSPILTFRGKTQSLGKWAKELGLRTNTLRDRIRRGWSVDRCLTEGLYNPRTGNIR